MKTCYVCGAPFTSDLVAVCPVCARRHDSIVGADSHHPLQLTCDIERSGYLKLEPEEADYWPSAWEKATARTRAAAGED